MSSSDRASSIGGSGSCQDCGNKAKRECAHLRCRTCCKSRGFVCPTHVKSTWVPVSRRRQHHRHGLSFHLHNPTFPSSSSSGLAAGGNYPSLPTEINTVANFRRVRVNSGDNEVDETAYQASVMVGGHHFKGILYDQGLCGVPQAGGGEGSSGEYHTHQYHQLAGMVIAPAAHEGNSSGGVNQQPPPPPPYSSNPNINVPHHQHHEYNFYYGSSSSSGHAPAAAFNASLLPPGMQFFPHPKP